MTKRFTYQDPIEVQSIKDIDAVIFSHDHYDHLDYATIKAIKNEVNHFYTPLGLGEHLKSWGVASEKITELDWWESANLAEIQLVATPARHFSGRRFARNKSLWASWVIKGTKNNIYFSGDSGYGNHFHEIGERYGPFDFAMMECGQYNEKWAAIHMMPEESVWASIDVKSKIMMPIHWGAFNLALHEWRDPILRANEEAVRTNVDLTHPIIGKRFEIRELQKEEWWSTLQ